MNVLIAEGEVIRRAWAPGKALVEANMARVRIIVRGVVQGVGFRYFTMLLARGYGLAGWVGNREDGSVEVEAEAEKGVLEAFIKDLGVGPRGAHVSGVDVESLPAGKGYKGFTVRP